MGTQSDIECFLLQGAVGCKIHKKTYKDTKDAGEWLRMVARAALRVARSALRRPRGKE